MKNEERKRRYAYIKNGDAEQQVRRLLPLTLGGPSNGPDAFIYELLCRWRDASILVLSRAEAERHCRVGDVEARVFRYSGRSFRELLYRLLSAPRVFVALVRFGPDRLLCGTTGSPLWMSFLVASWRQVPLVHSRHNQVLSPSRNWVKKLSAEIDLWVIRRAAAVICHGPYLKDQLTRVGIPAARIFEFDVTFEEAPVQQSTMLSPDAVLTHRRRMILYVGRIEIDKGVFDLLAATREHLQDGDVHLIYVGGGSQLGSLRRKVSEYRLEGKVSVLGYVAHEALGPFFKDARVVVTPSQGRFPEGRCMSVMEALVAGLPVIAPDYGPFPFLIKSGENGLLYETDSVPDLATKIGEMLDNEHLYQRLKKGAEESGHRLISPPLTFAESVERAFEAGVRG